MFMDGDGFQAYKHILIKKCCNFFCQIIIFNSNMLKVMTATTSPALVAQALSALSLKDSCAMLPLINNYTGHYNATNTRYIVFL